MFVKLFIRKTDKRIMFYVGGFPLFNDRESDTIWIFGQGQGDGKRVL